MQPKATTNHQKIMDWVIRCGGHPYLANNSKDKNEVLRIDFLEDKGDSQIEPISWDDFFQIFDSYELQLLFHDLEDDHMENHFYKFIPRTSDIIIPFSNNNVSKKKVHGTVPTMSKDIGEDALVSLKDNYDPMDQPADEINIIE